MKRFKTGCDNVTEPQKSRLIQTIRFISDLILTVILILAVLMVGSRLFGINAYTVMGSSMEPAYHIGSLIYVRPADPEDVNVGETITFYAESGSVPVTHRVIRIDQENEAYYTKGDANDSEDPLPVRFSKLIGKPIFSIPLLGYATVFLSTNTGKILAVMTVAMLIMITYIPDIVSRIKNDSKRENSANTKK